MKQGEYKITIVDFNGCLLEYEFPVYDWVSELKIPNIFTPNYDGINDLFEITHANLTDFSAKIFSRWGDLMFESHTPDISWNGLKNNKECAEGVYFIVLDAKGKDDISYNIKQFLHLKR